MAAAYSRQGHIAAASQWVTFSSAPPRGVSQTRGILCKKNKTKKTCPVKNKTQEALWFAFQEPRWWENNNGIFFPVRLHPELHTQRLRNSYVTAFFLSAKNI